MLARASSLSALRCDSAQVARACLPEIKRYH